MKNFFVAEGMEVVTLKVGNKVIQAEDVSEVVGSDDDHDYIMIELKDGSKVYSTSSMTIEVKPIV